MEEKKLLRKFQFILVDEKRTHIKYDGVEEKGPRPYMVVRPSMYGKYFIAVPLTDVESYERTSKKIRKSYLEMEYDGNKSYVKMNFVVLFPFALIDDGIIRPVDRHLNKSLRNVAIRLLKESFDD